MASILVLGAGWVGAPLADHLARHGHNVVATKTSSQGVEELKQQQIRGLEFCFSENADTVSQLYSLLLENNIEIVIGSFPPGFRKGSGKAYAQQWQQLVEASQKANIKKLIMVSSTTVYPEKPGTIDENDASLAVANTSSTYSFSDNAKIMLTAEQSVIDSGIDYTVLRFSGLIGPNRHPSRFASKLKQVSSQAPANMLHLDDAIRSVDFAITQLHNQVANVTTPNTVSKAEFYAAALKSANSKEPLPPVVDTPDKRVSSEKIISLGFSFKYNSTLDALDD